MSISAGYSPLIGPAGDGPHDVDQIRTHKELKYVLALDVGTTTIRAHVYDQATTIRGSGSRQVRLVISHF